MTFFLSAYLTEHFVRIHVVDRYSFLIIEYNKQESLQNKKNLTLHGPHDKKGLFGLLI